MAKSLLKVRTTKKTKRSTKSEAYLVNWKYLGDEPTFKGKVPIHQQINAFNWYNNMAEEEDVRTYINDFLKQTKNEDLIKKIKRVPFSHLPLTSAWVFRMTSRGAVFDDTTLDWATNKLKQSVRYAEEEKQEAKTVDKPSIQDRVKERVSEIIGEIEGILDSGELVNIYEWLQKNEIPAAHARKIAEYYKPLKEEYGYAIAVDNEGYEKYTKGELKIKLGYIIKLIEDCERFSGNVKKARAPRKKKAPTADKLLKHFQYQKESNEYKLQSCDPATILGAQELWIFNTKYKTLGVYRARGPSGLSIKRTSIDGYDSDASLIKRVGRKPEEYVKKVLNGGKIVLRKIMEEINTDPASFTDRINTNTILLRVVK
jgi:hypothetical protein